MQKAESRDYPKAGTAELTGSLIEWSWQMPVHLQEAESHSAGQVLSKQDHPNFTLGEQQKMPLMFVDSSCGVHTNPTADQIKQITCTHITSFSSLR